MRCGTLWIEARKVVVLVTKSALCGAREEDVKEETQEKRAEARLAARPTNACRLTRPEMPARPMLPHRPRQWQNPALLGKGWCRASCYRQLDWMPTPHPARPGHCLAAGR